MFIWGGVCILRDEILLTENDYEEGLPQCRLYINAYNKLTISSQYHTKALLYSNIMTSHIGIIAALS